MQISTLTNDELLRIAQAEIDTLTSTPLELELLRRFEAVIDDHAQTLAKLDEHGYADADAAAVLEAINEHEFDADDIHQLGAAKVIDASTTAGLLEVLIKAGYDSPDALQDDLALAERFASIASDAGDVFSRLSTLTETATTE